jgi:hypothetical protein
VTLKFVKVKIKSMITLKKAKMEALVKHLTTGGDEDQETLANVLGVEPEDTETVQAYMARARKPTPSAVSYMLRGADGIVKELEIVKQKENLILLQIPVVRDLVTILVQGNEVTVDLEELVKMPADALLHGTTITKLRAAAELAKG